MKLPAVAAWLHRSGIAIAACCMTACGFGPGVDSPPDLPRAEAAIGRPVELASGRIRSLDHPAFDHAAAQDALWAPLAMLEIGSVGIFFLQPYDSNRIPILFIPGIGGSPRDFRRMIESLDQSRFQAWVFNYPTGFRLDGVAALLHKVLEDVERKHHFPSLFITAHSLGGLVARRYIKSEFREAEHVKLLVTFSSPWEGHRWAAVGMRFMRSAVPSWRDLEPGSRFLLSLRAPPPEGAHNPPHYAFFGFHRTTSLLITESSDGTVPVSSQLPAWIQDQAERYWGYDATHVGILSHGAALARYNTLIGRAADAFDLRQPNAECALAPP